METVTLETVALLPDGRPMLCFGTRGQDPSLAGGLTSALYSFTREIDLRKTPADGLKIDVPGGGRMILRRAVFGGREVLVSVILHGILDEGIMFQLSDFGRILGEVVASTEDWSAILSGSFAALNAHRAEIYLESLRRWRATAKMRPLVSIEFKDVIRTSLSVLGKAIDLSEAFVSVVSDPKRSLKQDELLTLVAREILVLAADQELFLSLNSKGDPMKTALTVAQELSVAKPQALIEARKTFEEVKSNFIETVEHSINEQTAFFRLSERKATWTSEVVQAVYKRMGKRVPHMLLAHPTLTGLDGQKGLREMASEFVEAYLAERGPCGMMRRLLPSLRVDPPLARLLKKLVDKCGTSFNEPAAYYFAKLVEPELLKETILGLPVSDALGRYFKKALSEAVLKETQADESPEWTRARTVLHTSIAEIYAEVLEDIILRRELFLSKAIIIKDHLSKILATFQVIACMRALVDHKWRTVNISGCIPSYKDLITSGLANGVVTKEDGALLVDGEIHYEAKITDDPLLLRKLWGNWKVAASAIKHKMIKVLKDEFYSHLILFFQKYAGTAAENLRRFADFAKMVGTGALPTIQLEEPIADQRPHDLMGDEGNRLYDSVVSFYHRFIQFINESVDEMTKSEPTKRVAYAKHAFYTMTEIEKERLLAPKEELIKQIEISFERATARLETEISSAKEKVRLALGLGPPFFRYVGGSFEDPVVATRSCRLSPVEGFFEGGYPEVISSYSSIVLGLGVPDRIVKRALSRLNERKLISPVLKPLLKVKGGNPTALAYMQLSEYVRLFIENALSLARHQIDERYFEQAINEPINLGKLPVDVVDDPLSYIGRPSGVDWGRFESVWILKAQSPELPTKKSTSIQSWLDELNIHLLLDRYGSTLDMITRAAKLAGADIGKRVEDGLQRLKNSLASSGLGAET